VSIRWREYFIDFLKVDIPVDSIENSHVQTAEPMISDITVEEVKIAIKSLKNWKAPGSDNIPAELIKYGGEENISSKYAKRSGKKNKCLKTRKRQ